MHGFTLIRAVRLFLLTILFVWFFLDNFLLNVLSNALFDWRVFLFRISEVVVNCGFKIDD